MRPAQMGPWNEMDADGQQSSSRHVAVVFLGARRTVLFEQKTADGTHGILEGRTEPAYTRTFCRRVNWAYRKIVHFVSDGFEGKPEETLRFEGSPLFGILGMFVFVFMSHYGVDAGKPRPPWQRESGASV